MEGPVKMRLNAHARLCDFIGNEDLLVKHKDLKFNLGYFVSHLGEYTLDLQNLDDDEDCVLAYFSAFPYKTGMLDLPHYAFQLIYRNAGFAAALRKAVYKGIIQPEIKVNRDEFWYTVAHITKAFMQSMLELSMLYESKDNALHIRRFTSSGYSGITKQMLDVYVRYTGDLLVKVKDYISISSSLIEFGDSKQLMGEIAAISTGNIQPERADFMLHYNCKTHSYLKGAKIRR
jgi:hypothetical protein